jgi:hypothetical protein
MAQLSIVGSLEHQNGLIDRNPCFGDTLEHCPRHVAALGQRQRGAEVPRRRRHSLPPSSQRTRSFELERGAEAGKALSFDPAPADTHAMLSRSRGSASKLLAALTPTR